MTALASSLLVAGIPSGDESLKELPLSPVRPDFERISPAGLFGQSAIR